MTIFCVNANTWESAPVPWSTNPLYFPKLKALGTQVWVRCDMSLSNLTYFQRLKANGIKILGNINYGLVPAGQTLTGVAQWTTLVQNALTQYAGLIDAIEVWNEPDLPVFWNGYMNGTPSHYFELLKVVWNLVHSMGLNIPVIAGSIAVMFTYPYAIEPNPPTAYNYGATFLQGIKNLGADNYCDAYSFHVYQWFLDGRQPSIISATDVYNRAKSIVGTKPLWETEMGYGGTGVSQTQTRDWLVSKFNELIGLGCPFLTWFSFWEGDSTYALVNSDCTERPAYYAFQSFAGGTPAQRYVFVHWQDGDTNPTKTVNV